MNADDFAKRAAELLEDRGTERDQPNGERSMARCVTAFNAMSGHELSVEDGWLFMVYLKHARMRGGAYREDDYEDAIGYEALMSEEASQTRNTGIQVEENVDPNTVMLINGQYVSVGDLAFLTGADNAKYPE